MKIKKKNPVNPVRILSSCQKKIRCFFYPQITQISQMKINKKSAVFLSTDYTDFTDENQHEKIL